MLAVGYSEEKDEAGRAMGRDGRLGPLEAQAGVEFGVKACERKGEE